MKHRSRNVRSYGYNTSEEGAVMFIVMLILLMGTATAVFAMHATSYEIRASGYGRRAMQTSLVGENGITATMAWTDFVSPQVMRDQWLRPCAQNSRLRTGSPLNLQPFEPSLPVNKNACRLYREDLNVMNPSVSVVTDDTSLGPRQHLQTMILVDVYEDFDSGESFVGERADGRGRFINLDITYTARGRTRLQTDVRSSIAGDRDFHEGAADARVFAVTGPIQVDR